MTSPVPASVRWRPQVGWAALAAASALLAPLAPLVLWAVADRWAFPAVLPQRWGVRGFSEALTAPTGAAVGRSVAVGAAVAVCASVLGAAAGRVVGWNLIRHRGLTVALLMTPVAVPPVAVGMGLDTVVLRSGIPQTGAVIVILTVFALPYTVFTVGSRYAHLDPALEEQARLLGATPAQAYTRVTVPSLAAALAAAAFMSFLVGWTDYTVTLLVGGGQLVTLPMLIGAAASYVGNEPVVAALSLLSVLPPLMLLALAAQVVRALNPPTSQPATKSRPAAGGPTP
ncbi:ABC transporter permease [Pedococcus sp. NPDC057267]|uniref:ABC transporter permease n=1 Tax=Pedococcus sp. NPDC057267 TaxID=3346077 RepID=UPI00362F9C2F